MIKSNRESNTLHNEAAGKQPGKTQDNEKNEHANDKQQPEEGGMETKDYLLMNILKYQINSWRFRSFFAGFHQTIN